MTPQLVGSLFVSGEGEQEAFSKLKHNYAKWSQEQFKLQHGYMSLKQLARSDTATKITKPVNLSCKKHDHYLGTRAKLCKEHMRTPRTSTQ